MSNRSETNRSETVTPELLRSWPLPAPGESKHARGDVVVVGGAERSPGAVMLAGAAALRVGAGRLTLAVDERVATAVAVAVPECGVVPLRRWSLASAADDLGGADVVLFGPGLDDARQAGRMLRSLVDLVPADATVVLDAYALGVAPRVQQLEQLRGRLVFTPNTEEAARLLERDSEGMGQDDLPEAVSEIASRYGAVVTCFGVVGHPDGRRWLVEEGGPGLATSGSGDVLAGAIAGLAARGADPAQAAVWGTHAHAAAGDRLAVAVGPLGYLASELLPELPRVLVEIGR